MPASGATAEINGSIISNIKAAVLPLDLGVAADQGIA